MSDALPPDSSAPETNTTPVARQAVQEAAARLLHDAGVRAPPTPVADLLAHCGLQTERFALTDAYSDRGLPVPLARARADIWPQVRGMIDATARIVYTHRVLQPQQERFCALHELGHFSLEWHLALLKYCSESDLSPTARATWEREANLFAAACLFQGQGFAREADRAAFGLNTLRRLARRWEASLEAAGREYVESRRLPCALVLARLRADVATVAVATAGDPLLEIRYAVGSRAWRATVPGEGRIPRGARLPWSHPATRILLAGGTGTLQEPAVLPLEPSGEIAVQADMVGNGMDVLMLVRPERVTSDEQ
jgi:hypothetical protein